MLVSDGGQVIRVPVNGIRIASRATKGVTIFNTAEGEKVVSVERISEPQSDEGEESATAEEASPGDEPAGQMQNAAVRAALFRVGYSAREARYRGPNGVRRSFLRSKRTRSAS